MVCRVQGTGWYRMVQDGTGWYRMVQSPGAATWSAVTRASWVSTISRGCCRQHGSALGFGLGLSPSLEVMSQRKVMIGR